MNETYRIRVRGLLDDRWAAWFDASAIQRREDGSTVLTVSVPDQAALHGVITRIRDLGLPLISVIKVDQTQEGPDSQTGLEVKE